jgi:hypothetical protein
MNRSVLERRRRESFDDMAKNMDLYQRERERERERER